MVQNDNGWGEFWDAGGGDAAAVVAKETPTISAEKLMPEHEDAMLAPETSEKALDVSVGLAEEIGYAASRLEESVDKEREPAPDVAEAALDSIVMPEPDLSEGIGIHVPVEVLASAGEKGEVLGPSTAEQGQQSQSTQPSAPSAGSGHNLGPLTTQSDLVAEEIASGGHQAIGREGDNRAEIAQTHHNIKTTAAQMHSNGASQDEIEQKVYAQHGHVGQGLVEQSLEHQPKADISLPTDEVSTVLDGQASARFNEAGGQHVSESQENDLATQDIVRQQEQEVVPSKHVEVKQAVEESVTATVEADAPPTLPAVTLSAGIRDLMALAQDSKLSGSVAHMTAQTKQDSIEQGHRAASHVDGAADLPLFAPIDAISQPVPTIQRDRTKEL